MTAPKKKGVPIHKERTGRFLAFALVFYALVTIALQLEGRSTTNNIERTITRDDPCVEVNLDECRAELEAAGTEAQRRLLGLLLALLSDDAEAIVEGIGVGFDGGELAPEEPPATPPATPGPGRPQRPESPGRGPVPGEGAVPDAPDLPDTPSVGRALGNAVDQAADAACKTTAQLHAPVCLNP